MPWVVRKDTEKPDLCDESDGYAAVFSGLAKKMCMLVKSLVTHPSTVVETKTQ